MVADGVGCWGAVFTTRGPRWLTVNTVADGETEGRASARMGCVEFDFVTGCPELSISGLEDADFLFPLHLLSCSILLLDLHNI